LIEGTVDGAGTGEKNYEEVAGCVIQDFRLMEDGLARHINHVVLELPRVRDVQGNLSHHFENSYTRRGV
jgi:hypothetical protein